MEIKGISFTVLIESVLGAAAESRRTAQKHSVTGRGETDTAEGKVHVAPLKMKYDLNE